MKFAQICLVALALLLAACQSSAPGENATKPAANSDPAKPATTAAPAATLDLSTPTKTAIAFYQGVKNKDAEKVKNTLSKATLAEAEKQAQDSGKAIMETIQQSAPPPDSQPDTGKEAVTGNTATLEVTGLDQKNKDKAATFYFVKEGNDWKLDLFHEDAKEEKAPEAKKTAAPK